MSTETLGATLLISYNKSWINFFCSSLASIQTSLHRWRYGELLYSWGRGLLTSRVQQQSRWPEHLWQLKLTSVLTPKDKQRKSISTPWKQGRGCPHSSRCSPTTLGTLTLLQMSQSSPLCQTKVFCLNSNAAGFCALKPNAISNKCCGFKMD